MGGIIRVSFNKHYIHIFVLVNRRHAFILAISALPCSQFPFFHRAVSYICTTSSRISPIDQLLPSCPHGIMPLSCFIPFPGGFPFSISFPPFGICVFSSSLPLFSGLLLSLPFKSIFCISLSGSLS